MEDYKRTMGRVRASDDLKKRIKHSIELEKAPMPLGERRAVRPGVARALTLVAAVVVTLTVLLSLALFIRFVGPEADPPSSGEIGIAPETPTATGFKLISCGTECDDVTVRVDSGSANGTVGFTWINGTEYDLVYSEYFYGYKLIDGEWTKEWPTDKEEVIYTVPDIARIVMPHSESKDSMELSRFSGNITPGRYKLETDFHVNSKTYTLTIEFELTEKQVDDGFELPDELELISISTDCDKVKVSFGGYDPSYDMISVDWVVDDGYGAYNFANEGFSIYRKENGEWLEVKNPNKQPGGDIAAPDVLYESIIGRSDYSMSAYQLTSGEYKLTKVFALGTQHEIEPIIGEYTLKIEFELTDLTAPKSCEHAAETCCFYDDEYHWYKCTEGCVFSKAKHEFLSDGFCSAYCGYSRFIGGTGGPSIVTVVDCGSDASEKCPGLTASVVDFDEGKKLLWVDFTNNGAEKYTVEASFALVDRNEGGQGMITEVNGAFSVMPGAVTHASFVLSDWQGDLFSRQYALLLSVDGQSVRINFDLYVDTP